MPEGRCADWHEGYKRLGWGNMLCKYTGFILDIADCVSFTWLAPDLQETQCNWIIGDYIKEEARMLCGNEGSWLAFQSRNFAYMLVCLDCQWKLSRSSQQSFSSRHKLPHSRTRVKRALQVVGRGWWKYIQWKIRVLEIYEYVSACYCLYILYMLYRCCSTHSINNVEDFFAMDTRSKKSENDL